MGGSREHPDAILYDAAGGAGRIRIELILARGVYISIMLSRQRADGMVIY